MLVPKSAGPLLLLLSVAANAANRPVPAVLPAGAPLAAPPAQHAPPATPAAVGPDPAPAAKSVPPTAPSKAPKPSEVNKEPGSVDAPVDGLDGKPHTGPGLFETKEKGTGDVGISGGQLSVDIKKPPPHTGDHEIVGIDDGKDVDEANKVRPPDSAWRWAFSLFPFFPPSFPARTDGVV